jgi:hypothetical protein
MNTIDDLRRTLDQHAGDVADPAAVARATAVHHRSVSVRRRRRAVVASGLAAVVLAGAAVVSWPRGSDALPAAPVVLGQQAPTSISSLGYTYRTDGHGESFGRNGSVKVSASSDPRLYSWTTDGGRSVSVTLPDGEVVHSDRQGFGDFVVLDPGAEGTLRISTPSGHVGLASYALTDAAPSGYTKAGVTYRASVAGSPLLAARVGELGQAVLHASYVSPGSVYGISVMCAGLPHGYVLNVSMNGDGRTAGDSCDSDGSFDPGSHVGAVFSPTHAGKRVRVRAWVTRGYDDPTPLASGAVPDLRIGVGVYGPIKQLHVARTDVPTVVEHHGHTWDLAGTSVSTGAPIRVPAASVDRLATMAWHTHGQTEVTFHVDSAQAPEGGRFGSGQAALPGAWTPAGSPIEASLDHGTGTFVVATYRRAD